MYRDEYNYYLSPLGERLCYGAALRNDDVKKLVLGDYPPLIPPFNQDWLNKVLKSIDEQDVDQKLPKRLFEEIQFTDYRPLLCKIEAKALILQGMLEGGMLGENGDEALFGGLKHKAFCKSQTGHNVFGSRVCWN
jgi:hypothetical protein